MKPVSFFVRRRIAWLLAAGGVTILALCNWILWGVQEVAYHGSVSSSKYMSNLSADLGTDLKQQLHLQMRAEAEALRQSVEKALASLASEMESRGETRRELRDSIHVKQELGALVGPVALSAGRERDQENGLDLLRPPQMCGRQSDIGRKGRVVWSPDPNRFVLAMCSEGQMSNRLTCIRQNLLGAALLNRTLVLPTSEVEYDYEAVLDLNHLNECFGAKVVVPLSDFDTSRKRRRRARRTDGNRKGDDNGREPPPFFMVDRMVCHIHFRHNEHGCAPQRDTYEEIGIKFREVEVAKWRPPSSFAYYSSADFLRLFGPGSKAHRERAIGFANMFGVCCSDMRFFGAQPLVVKDQCKYYLQPSAAIREAAAGFVSTYLGTRFLGVHFRRGDFLTHCLVRHKADKWRCFHPIPQVARCLARHIRRLNLMPDMRPSSQQNATETTSPQKNASLAVGGGQSTPIPLIFLATNGSPNEASLLAALTQSELGTPIGVIRVPPGAAATESWGRPLVRLNLEDDPIVMSVLDKTICAMATAFVGTYGSTYTSSVNTIRDWWHTNSCMDGFVCDPMASSDTVALEDVYWHRR